jgi:hypothetical protein
MVIAPTAEAINYVTDNSGAYLGVDEAQGERMRVFFADQKIRRIVIEQDPKHTMSPMKDPGVTTLRLSRFMWREEERPRSVAELFQ